MKFFADTADIADIKDLAATGLLDGVTTNPSLIAKSGRDFIEVTREICALTDGPVSAEVVALDHVTMMKEAEILRKIADNVCIKVPLTVDGHMGGTRRRERSRAKTFRPQKTVPEGGSGTGAQLRRHIDATLGSGNLREAVRARGWARACMSHTHTRTHTRS